MFAALLPLFLGSIPSVIKSIADARLQLANAETEKQKIEAEENIKALEARRDVLLKESNGLWNNVARFLFVAPVAMYWFWTIVWDKILCRTSCSTDPLADWQMNIFWTILGFYFVTDLAKLWKR